MAGASTCPPDLLSLVGGWFGRGGGGGVVGRGPVIPHNCWLSEAISAGVF